MDVATAKKPEMLSVDVKSTADQRSSASPEHLAPRFVSPSGSSLLSSSHRNTVSSEIFFFTSRTV